MAIVKLFVHSMKRSEGDYLLMEIKMLHETRVQLTGANMQSCVRLVRSGEIR